MNLTTANYRFFLQICKWIKEAGAVMLHLAKRADYKKYWFPGIEYGQQAI